MPSHPTYDPFHLLIDADSDVFTAELDDDAGGDEDPPSVAEPRAQPLPSAKRP